MPTLRNRPSTSGTSRISPIKEISDKNDEPNSRSVSKPQNPINPEEPTSKKSQLKSKMASLSKDIPKKIAHHQKLEPKSRHHEKQSFILTHDHSPIYVITKIEDKVTLPIPKFSSCYICGKNVPKKLEDCHDKKCTLKFHLNCAQKYSGGDYTFFFQQRNGGVYCPRHHCNRCFVDRNRSRCFNGKLIKCEQCPVAWHIDCIPAGCTIAEKKCIICPRHRLFPAKLGNHMLHCHDCQKDDADLDCIRCLRSFHFSCLKSDDLSSTGTELTDAFRQTFICHWCHNFEFVKVGQYANAKLGNNKWYPCKVIANDDYPYPDKNLGMVGYVAIQWLPYHNRIYFNVMPHNRVIEMYEKDYFYVLDAPKSDCEEEWDEAQQQVIVNCPQNFPPKEDQVVFGYSNGHKVSMISKNIYTEKEILFDPDNFREAITECVCKEDDRERCGPKSGCINRALFSECPENCGKKSGICLNKEISNHMQKKVEIFKTSDRGFGIRAKEIIPKGHFIGEYIGEVITEKEKNRRLEDIGRWGNIEAQFYILMFDKRRYIDAQFKGNEMRYANHSCEPNAVVHQIKSKKSYHMCLFALRDIKIDEEITFDYKMGKFLEDIPLPICRCKSQSCEGVMNGKNARKLKKNDEITDFDQPSTSSGMHKMAKRSIDSKKKSKKTKKEHKPEAMKSPTKKSSTPKKSQKAEDLTCVKVEIPIEAISKSPMRNSPRLEIISVKSDTTPEPTTRPMSKKKSTSKNTPTTTPLKEYNFRNKSFMDDDENLNSPEVSPLPIKITSTFLAANDKNSKKMLLGRDISTKKRAFDVKPGQKENLEPIKKKMKLRGKTAMDAKI